MSTEFNFSTNTIKTLFSKIDKYNTEYANYTIHPPTYLSLLKSLVFDVDDINDYVKRAFKSKKISKSEFLMLKGSILNVKATIKTEYLYCNFN